MISELDDLPLTRLHVWTLVACAAGFTFDLAEIAFGNILSAVFSAPPHVVGSTQLSWLLASVYIGAAVGAPIVGILADRYGRRTMLISAMVLLAASSLLAGCTSGIVDLIVWRAVAGVSLGAYPPLMFAYLTDLLPARRRGPVTVMATAFAYLGPPAFIFLVRGLTPVAPMGIEAWRWGFAVAAVGALACSLGFRRVPESPRWLLQRGRIDDANSIIESFRRSAEVMPAIPAPVSIDRNGEQDIASRARSLWREALFLLPLFLLTPWTTVGFSLLSGAVLVHKGISLQDSLLLIGIGTLAPFAGTLAAGAIVDHLERRVFLTINALIMGLLGLLFGASQSSFLLLTTATTFNVVLSLFLPVLVLFAAEATSTAHRARLTAWSWTSNRVGSALVPIVLLPILERYGAVEMFAAVACTIPVFIGMLWFFARPAQAGRTVK
ncbi:MFS transporter [Rhizobium calliandrae]|uniref:MFS transporter n=1 Tax=Rhizobium calliandrae TaxID=1312182 RepID=A0ABT7KLR3_9HYPH|nr:MFS transporter [Rhizobium calliandrae]MDL2408203.1 MFS transporter [Rhizobium calliandrae]